MCKNQTSADLNNDGRQILAIAYVPMQDSDFENLLPGDEALVIGTVFPELYLPFTGERN